MSKDFIKNQIEFRDFDAFAEKINQGDIQNAQLDKGNFIGSLTQIKCGPIILSAHRMNRTILQQGIGVLGYTTFLIPGNMDQDISWRKNRLRGNCLGILKSGMEHCGISQSNFLGKPVSISNNYLEEIATILGYPNFIDYINKNETIEISKKRALQIHNIISLICNFEVNVDLLLTYELPKLIILSISESNNDGKFTFIKPSGHIFKNTQDFIESNIDDKLNILSLCKEVGVSERNLRYIFKDRIGISPKKYIQSIKLNKVRKILKTNAMGENVNSIANSVGFWHSGQFAADYKRLFGELPSETLNY